MSAPDKIKTTDRIYYAFGDVLEESDRDPDPPGHDSEIHARPFWALARTVADIVGDEEVTGMWPSVTGDAFRRDYRIDVFTSRAVITGSLSMSASETTSEEPVAPELVEATRRRLTDVQSVMVTSSSRLRRAPMRGVDASFEARAVRGVFRDGHVVDLVQSEMDRRHELGIERMLEVWAPAGV